MDHAEIKLIDSTKRAYVDHEYFDIINRYRWFRYMDEDGRRHVATFTDASDRLPGLLLQEDLVLHLAGHGLLDGSAPVPQPLSGDWEPSDFLAVGLDGHGNYFFDLDERDIIPPVVDSEGYNVQVFESEDGPVIVRVDDMVATMFIGPCPPNHVIEHIDGDKTNDRADNLRWVPDA